MKQVGHRHGHPHLPRAGADRRAMRRLGLVLVLTLGYAAAELVGGLLSNSLALLADAGHMLTDILALGLALFAAWSAGRPPDSTRTFGYKRAEILAALFNGAALIVMALFIFAEAWDRMWSPPEVDHPLMAAVAAGGLLVNVAAAWILHGHLHGLNMRAAYLHVLGDLLGSIGVLAAAGTIAFLGWRWADPAVSVVIGGIIVFNAVLLVADSVHVLLESAPAHVETEQVRRRLLDLPGVCGIHDLHVWSLEGDVPLLSAHLVLDHTESTAGVLREAKRALAERFAIHHATLQLEPPDFDIVENLTDDE